MDNLNPLVSFCLLTYNQEEFIEEAINGALMQTYNPLEIIISDDCSTDNTFNKIIEITRKYVGPHKIIINKNKQNLGLAAHVNKLLYEISKGEFIALAAGDDISLSERITKSIKFFKGNNDLVALSTPLIIIDQNGKILSNEGDSKLESKIFDIDFYLSENYFHINGPSRIIRRKILNIYPPLQENCPTEDTTFLLRCFMSGKVGLLDEALVKYRRHDNNITSTQNIKKIKINKIHEQYKIDIHHAKNAVIINEETETKLLNKLDKLLQNVASNRRKKIKDNIKFIIKRAIRFKFPLLLYIVLLKLAPTKKAILDAYFYYKISLRNIIKSQFNLIFFKSNSIILAGYTESKNFGDALNVPFLKILSKSKIIEANCIDSQNTNKLLMIGSTLHLSDKNTIIWGAGCISEENIPPIKPLKINAVRGPLTRGVLIQNGYDCPEVYGDPALLLPYFYKPNLKKRYKLGVIPHYIDLSSDFISKISKNKSVTIININVGRDYKEFINQVLKCDSIISSSLHGLIIADAYNIPNVWVEFSKNVIGNGFKFRDYFMSIKRELTEPLILHNDLEIITIQEHLKKWNKPKIDLEKLFGSFPTELLSKKNKHILKPITDKLLF
jgi:pyruvyltransferase